ncbi:protein jagged-1b-like, partial [Limulus polyphemus]|uniref:Protein jagged-1b-like n=1 Tax=Limulus polyphemus TaxID=6850 RepID=A0ABM1BHU1_LIMPO
TFSNISDQCSYGSFCTPPNICVSGDKFHCKCQKGYSSVYIKKYSNIGTEDICVDIDECTDKNLNECENSTICTNLPGEYKCKCKENFKHVENNDKKCIEMCEDNPCGGRGECKTLKNDFFCKCKEGYSGRLCDTKDEILKSAKMKTIIVGAVLGSILLLVIIIAGVSISKLKSKKKVHNDDHYLEELPSQNQDRTGMKAAYDNPAMKRN